MYLNIYHVSDRDEFLIILLQLKYQNKIINLTLSWDYKYKKWYFEIQRFKTDKWIDIDISDKKFKLIDLENRRIINFILRNRYRIYDISTNNRHNQVI